MGRKAQRTAELAEDSSGASAVPTPELASGNSQLRTSTVSSSEQLEFARAVVAFFTDAADLLGVPHSIAAIYGVVFASPVPLSFAEIGERLELSKGSISQGLKALREVGAVKEVSAPTDRTELFVPDTEMRKLIERFLSSRVQPHLDTGKHRLVELKRLSAAFPSSEQAILRQRVEKLQAWHDRTRGLLPLVRTFLKLGA